MQWQLIKNEPDVWKRFTQRRSTPSSDGFTTLQRSLGIFSTIKRSSTEEIWALWREGLLGKSAEVQFWCRRHNSQRLKGAWSPCWMSSASRSDTPATPLNSQPAPYCERICSSFCVRQSLSARSNQSPNARRTLTCAPLNDSWESFFILVAVITDRRCRADVRWPLGDNEDLSASEQVRLSVEGRKWILGGRRTAERINKAITGQMYVFFFFVRTRFIFLKIPLKAGVARGTLSGETAMM